MRHLKVTLSALLLAYAASAASAQTNLAYWNFNDATGTTVNAAARTALFSPDGGVNISSATMSSSFSFVDGTTGGNTGINFAAGSTVNAIGVTVAGNALNLQGGISANGTPNNGQSLTFSVSTVGYSSIIVSFAAQRNGPGFDTNQFQIFNGSTFVNVGGTFNPSNGSFATQTFDLSAVPQVNFNPNATFRIVFNNASNAGGENRIDNLQINGTVTGPEPASGLLAIAGVAIGGLVAYRRRK